MTKALPTNPNLEYDKKQAKALLKAYKAGDESALERVRQEHPRLQNVPERTISPDDFKLSDAQLVIAHEYGFSSWPRLKHEIELVQTGLAQQFAEFVSALQANDVPRVRNLLETTPGLVKHINDPCIDFDAPAVIPAARKGREMLDLLLSHGADINAKSEWWAGGYGVLHGASRSDVDYLVERGAKLDAWSAAEQDNLDALRQLVEAEPEVVHAKGPDGQRPLHYARSKAAIDFLLEHGAEIDARDLDHRGTAAQYLLADHYDLTRYLLERGAQPDIFMVCMLGDLERVKALLSSDPGAVNRRIGERGYAPVPLAPGFHIYIYSLGNGQSPTQIARKFRHEAIYQLLIEHSSPHRRFVAACERADTETAQKLLAESPDLVASLSVQDQQLLVDSAWNNQFAAVELMLKAGFNPHVENNNDGMTALHAAAFHGFADLVNLLLKYDPPLTQLNRYGGTPLSTAVYGSVHSWKRGGNFPAVVDALLKAGSPLEPLTYPSGNAAVDALLKPYLQK